MAKCTSEIECYVEKALVVIGGKWSFLIIKHLFTGTKRFGELRKLLDISSPKTLTDALRNLEANEIITRRVEPTIPPKVFYTLTEKGEAFEAIIIEMKLWGEKWLPPVGSK